MGKTYFIINVFIEADEASHTAYKFIEIDEFGLKIKNLLKTNNYKSISDEIFVQSDFEKILKYANNLYSPTNAIENKSIYNKLNELFNIINKKEYEYDFDLIKYDIDDIILTSGNKKIHQFFIFNDIIKNINDKGISYNPNFYNFIRNKINEEIDYNEHFDNYTMSAFKIKYGIVGGENYYQCSFCKTFFDLSKDLYEKERLIIFGDSHKLKCEQCRNTVLNKDYISTLDIDNADELGLTYIIEFSEDENKKVIASKMLKNSGLIK